MSSTGTHSLRPKSTSKEITKAFRRAVSVLKGSSLQINRNTVAERAALYVPESAGALYPMLEHMSDAELIKDLGFPDKTPQPQSAGSGTKLLTSLHWRGRKQTRPPSRR
jgi:hypothetical protein